MEPILKDKGVIQMAPLLFLYPKNVRLDFIKEF
jgi:hypothetical protein